MPLLRFLAPCFAGMLLLAQAYAATPELVTVQGVLEDASGAALTGSRDWRVRFYGAASGGAAIATRTGSTVVGDRGVFAFDVEMPDSALEAADLHYELSIDADATPNGIDANDIFPNRIRVTSVPFARRAATATSADRATTATYAASAGAAETAIQAFSAVHADAAGTAAHAATADSATDATNAQTAALALSAQTAEFANLAGSASTATSATTADTATNALNLGGKPASAYSPRLYEAIVDAAGGGDFTTIQAAITAGAHSIFVRNGSYTLTGTVTIPAAPFSMVGESPDGVVINCAGTRSILYVGDTAVYSQGGVTVTNGSTTVTGTSGSPQWTSNAAAGDIIRIGRTYHLIASVNSDTSLTLSSPYFGISFTDTTYSIGTYGRGFMFRNLTLVDPPDASNSNQNATQGGICLRFAREITIENCRARRATNNFGHLAYLENCHIATITSCQNDGPGLVNASNSSNVLVQGNLLRNARARAIYLTGRGDDEPNFDMMAIGNIVSGGTGGGAIVLTQVSAGSVLSAVIANNMISAWDSTSASTTEAAMVISTVTGSVVISGNTIDRGSGTALLLTGVSEKFSITGNTFVNNGGFGIRGQVGSTLSNSVIASNVLLGNALGGTNLTAANGTMNLPKYEVPVP